MVAAGAFEIVAGTFTIVGVLLLMAAAVVVWSTVRSVRRWYRRRWAMLAGLGRAAATSGAMATVASLPVTERFWWGVQRDRHRMWRAVTGAERAVAAAVAAGAPTGDLPTLVRQLRRTADSLDAVLGVSGHSSAAAASARRQVSELAAAAGQLKAAAIDALNAVAAPATAGLADAVRVEVAALRHGLTTLSTGPRR